jgi:hypothetical protein
MMKPAVAAFLILSFASGVQAQVLDVTPGVTSPPADSGPTDLITRQELGDFDAMLLRQRPVGGSIQDAWTDAAADAGIVKYPHPRFETMKVLLREGMATALVFNNDDVLNAVSGDTVNFGVERGELSNVLYVWPKATGYDTSLIVETEDGAVFAFYLRSETFLSKNIPHTKVLIGPTNDRLGSLATTDIRDITINADGSRPPPVDSAEPETDANGIPFWTRSSSFDPEKLRHDLEMSGDMEIAPVGAFRDDKFTWLYWGEESDADVWPAVWKVVDDIDQPARIRRTRDGRYLIVEHTGPLTLRHGEKILCLRPRA